MSVWLEREGGVSCAGRKTQNDNYPRMPELESSSRAQLQTNESKGDCTN